MIEGKDYMIIDPQEDLEYSLPESKTSIRILGGEFTGQIFSFDVISIKEEGDTAVVSFTYTVHGEVASEIVDFPETKEKFDEVTSSVLDSILQLKYADSK
jgi:hypothetical protein